MHGSSATAMLANPIAARLAFTMTVELHREGVIFVADHDDFNILPRLGRQPGTGGATMTTALAVPALFGGLGTLPDGYHRHRTTPAMAQGAGISTMMHARATEGLNRG